MGTARNPKPPTLVTPSNNSRKDLALLFLKGLTLHAAANLALHAAANLTSPTHAGVPTELGEHEFGNRCIILPTAFPSLSVKLVDPCAIVYVKL